MTNNKDNNEVYSQHKCAGCGRNVIHKFCPAYGTPFYCSGVEFSKETEGVIKELKSLGYNDADKIVYLLMTLWRKDDIERENDRSREV